MKPMRRGVVIGLAGNVAFGWGLYHLMGIGSCGGEYPPCPSSATPYFLAVPMGFLLSFGGIIAGGGGFTFVGMFGAVGVASILRGINGGVGPEGDTTFAFSFGAVFLLPFLLPLIFIPFARRRLRRAERLVAEGSKAIATVTAVDDTNVTLNDNPRVRLTLSVQPEDGGAPFETTKTMVVSRLRIPRVGDRYPAWYDPRDTSKVGIATAVEASAPAGVRALWAKATQPTPLPDPEVQGALTATPVKQEWVNELARLNDLRLSGALTDDEFNQAKERLLAGSPPAPAAG